MPRRIAVITIGIAIFAVLILLALQYYPIGTIIPTLQPARVVEINLVSKQWFFNATIIKATDQNARATTTPTYDSFANTTIVVTKGDLLMIHYQTGDVPHGFAIIGYPGVGPYEVTPGQTITFQFTVNQAGRFTFYCTEFCGPGHSSHKGTLIVLP